MTASSLQLPSRPEPRAALAAACGLLVSKPSTVPVDRAAPRHGTGFAERAPEPLIPNRSIRPDSTMPNPQTDASTSITAHLAAVRESLVLLLKALWQRAWSGAPSPAAASTSRPATPSDAGVRSADLAIRARLLAALERQPWWRGEVSNVFVIDGVVIYQGLCHGRKDRQATHLASTMLGVREVRDARVRRHEWQAMT